MTSHVTAGKATLRKYLTRDNLMNARKKKRYCQSGPALAIIVLLWTLLASTSFSQNTGGTGTAGEDKAGGVTMQAVSGKVVETMNSGGYTYALVKENGVKTWVALPKSRLAVGDEIACQPGMVMNNFSSPSLNRSFKQIVFSGGLTSLSGSAAPPEAAPVPEEVIQVPKIKEPKDWKDF